MPAALRPTYLPESGAPAGVARLVATAPAGFARGGELTLVRPAGLAVRATLPAAQLRDVLRRWAAAALAGRGDPEIGE